MKDDRGLMINPVGYKTREPRFISKDQYELTQKALPYLCKQFPEYNKGHRLFPIQKSSPIPWEDAEIIYSVYAALFGRKQSLERLAERGGLGFNEVEAIALEYERTFNKPRPANYPRLSQ